MEGKDLGLICLTTFTAGVIKGVKEEYKHTVKTVTPTEAFIAFLPGVALDNILERTIYHSITHGYEFQDSLGSGGLTLISYYIGKQIGGKVRRIYSSIKQKRAK